MKNPLLLVGLFLILFVFGCNELSMKKDEPIEAFSIDFNWGWPGSWAFADTGTWSDANPAEHIKWYKDLGVNTIQTFCISSNGYAWYKTDVVPEQPGLKYDFLKEMVQLGRKENMRVMGYYTVGSNTRWGRENPEYSYGASPKLTPGMPHNCHIPYTDKYLSYLDSVVRDAIIKTDIDGFMLDWLWMPTRETTNGIWIDSEKKLFEQLMNKPFPGEDNLSVTDDIEYSRKAIDRCWNTMMKAAKETKPECILWLSCNNPGHPHVQNSDLFKEIDWLMNEAGDLESINAVKNMIGSNTKLVTCLASWNKMDATILVPEAVKNNVGVYGYGQPYANSLFKPIDKYLSLPIDSFIDDERNIATLARAFNQLPLNYIKE